MTERLFFACDYMEGAHPAIMQRLMETNLVKTAGYGSMNTATALKKRYARRAAFLMQRCISLWAALRLTLQL